MVLHGRGELGLVVVAEVAEVVVQLGLPVIEEERADETNLRLGSRATGDRLRSFGIRRRRRWRNPLRVPFLFTVVVDSEAVSSTDSDKIVHFKSST